MYDIISEMEKILKAWIDNNLLLVLWTHSEKLTPKIDENCERQPLEVLNDNVMSHGLKHQ